MKLPIVNITITIPGGHFAGSKRYIQTQGWLVFVADMMNLKTQKNYSAEQMAIELQKNWEALFQLYSQRDGGIGVFCTSV